MILKYTEYIQEKIICDLLLESKVVFSKGFIGILSRMRGNPLAEELLSLYSQDIPVQYNFIDITDEKDAVSFTLDKKVQQIISEKPEEWQVMGGAFLTHHPSNDKVFNALGYEKVGEHVPHPDQETIGHILAETVGSNGRVYAKFQYIDETGETMITVMNKQSLVLVDPSEDLKIWKSSRSNIKIGRLVRSVLTAAKIPFNDKDIESFTNQYKATYDFTKDLLKQFDVVKGSDISHWYYYEHYVRGGGVMNNSCMAEVDSSFFDLYVYNTKQVSLVILYSDEGTFNGGNYSSNKIKGRAILWDCLIDGNPEKYMDRIYTVQDSDVELFKQFAVKNGWWFKTSQTMSSEEKISNGEVIKKSNIIVNLENSDFDKYPYLDTVCYLNRDKNTLSNHSEKGTITLHSTDGYWDEYRHDYDDDDYYGDYDYDDEESDDDDDDESLDPVPNFPTGTYQIDELFKNENIRKNKTL
jgi:hypothetical protein